MTLLLLLMISVGNLTGISQLDPNEEIRLLLNEFLSKVDQAEMHDRFWAEDLIYTSSSGKRFGKSEIMEGFENPSESEPEPTYSAENVDIRVYGDMATLAFTLVAEDSGTISQYLNSGTLIKRKGDWKVILWQATKKGE